MNSKEVCPQCERPLYPVKPDTRTMVLVPQSVLEDIAETLQDIAKGLEVLVWET